jgi:methionyl-tRNA formyltransferase
MANESHETPRELESLRIIYMGTPEFAVAPLRILREAGCQIVSVVTAPDRPAGRGQKIRFSAVKEYALESNLPLLQPVNLKDPGFVSTIQELDPDLQVVVAFRMLPRVIWSIPALGTFNLHASLLPHYRGAAPINHVIINGESETGVTTFLIDDQIDTGKILLREKTPIGERETAGQLHDRLMTMGAGLVLNTVRQLAGGQLVPESQESLTGPETILKSAPKIRKEECRIDWGRPGKELYNFIRGLSPYPAAHTCLEKGGGKGVLCKIYAAEFESASHNLTHGTLVSDGKRNLHAAVAGGFLHIHSLQQEGKRRMDTADFLAGTTLTSYRARFS